MQSNIAIISYPKFLSGLTQYSSLLFKAITGRITNKKVYFICTSHDGDHKNLEYSGITPIIEKTRLLPLSIVKLIFFVYCEKIQIIHFQSFFKYPILTYLLAKFFKTMGKSVFFTAHDILPHYQHYWDLFFTKKLYQSVDGVIVHSLTNKKELMELMGEEKEVEIKIIPHPMYDNFILDKMLNKKKARQKIGIGQTLKILLFFGHIESRKGVEALLREFPAILKKDKNMYLMLVGRDHFPAGYLNRLVSDLNIKNHVSIENRFIEDEDVSLFFSAADAVVLPYLRGSTSGVLKIAFAHKTPAIATKIGELPEMINTYHSGILIDLPLKTDDVEAIVSMVQKDSLSKFYSNYDELIEYFSWESAARKTIAFYERINQI